MRSGGWLDQIHRGVLETAGEGHRHLLTLHPGDLGDVSVAWLRQAGVTGFIAEHNHALPPAARDLVLAVQQAGIRVVAGGDEPWLAAADRAFSDHAAGCEMLCDWLVRERGRRRILRFWHDVHIPWWRRQRNEGYEQVLRRHGLPSLPAVYLPPPVAGGSFPLTADGLDAYARGICGHLAEHVTGPNAADAILLDSDGQYWPVARALELLHRSPADILVCGYDNYALDRPWGDVAPGLPVATVDKRNRETGQRLVELLLERLAGKLPPEPQVIRLPPELVVLEQ